MLLVLIFSLDQKKTYLLINRQYYKNSLKTNIEVMIKGFANKNK